MGKCNKIHLFWSNFFNVFYTEPSPGTGTSPGRAASTCAPAQSSQRYADGQTAESRRAATGGNFRDVEEETDLCEHVSLTQTTAHEKATVKAQYNHMTWLY